MPSPYHRDTNWALFDSTLTAMRKADPDPQVVILSGDFLAHRFPRNVPLAERTMARIVRGFNAAFPRAQFVIVPGNNDDPCGDYRVTPGSPYFAYIAHAWAPLVNRNGAAPGFERTFARYGWYQARLPVRGMRVIALDSVYWSVVYRSCANYTPDGPQRERQWLAQALDALPANSRAVIVMHIPPGVDAHSTLATHRLLVVPFWQQGASAAFSRILSQHAHRIAFALAGHVHRDDFRLIGNVPLLVAPSVSPIYANNPAFLRLDVAPDGTLTDYRPFVYDEWPGSWHQLETFDRTFGVNAFTSQALTSIHERLRGEQALRARWALWYMSGSGDREITSGTWRTYWCAQTSRGSQFVGCAGLQRRIQVLPIAAGLALAAVVALLAFVSVRLARARPRA